MLSVGKGRLSVRSNFGKFFLRYGRIQDNRNISFLSINVYCDLVLSNKLSNIVIHYGTVATVESVVDLGAEQANLVRWQVLGQTR